MKTTILSLTVLLASSFMVPITTTAANKGQEKAKTSVKKGKKQSSATRNGKILPMSQFVDQLMAKMTLQEKIGQLNLMVAGNITTGSVQSSQVGSDIAQGNMGGVFNI